MDNLPASLNLPLANVWLVGSRMYGLHNEDSDYDYTGVYFDLVEFCDPLVDREKTKTWDNNNLTLHSFAKFARLLVKGNPNMIDLVFHSPVRSCEVGRKFVEVVKPHVITQNVASAYMGYLNEQKRRGFKPSTPQNPQRKAQLEELGYDTKYLMHFLRLSYMLQDVLLTKTYGVLDEARLYFLKEVRAGTFTHSTMMTVANQEYEVTEKLYAQYKDELPNTDSLRHVISDFFYFDWVRAR